MMTPELWQRLKPLYSAALDLPGSARARFVIDACGDDLELKRELEALLEAHEQKTSTRDGPLVDLLDFIPGPALFPGASVLNRYKVVQRLGAGGMGEVYEVEDRFLQGVHVAMKTILPHKSDDLDLQRRFEREVLLAREVTHPNLCPMYDIAHCDDPPPGFLFLTMKLLPGTTLSERLKKGDAISPEDRLAILSKIALGLSAIHNANIVHRDIKPGNIMLHGTGSELRLWITDFGLARAYQTETTVVEKSMLAGTRGYMAPELFLGQMPSQASDLFAFGVVLHEVFVNEKPAASLDGSTYMVSPRLASPDVPAFCVTLITECLSHDPKRRCLAFEEVLKEIEPSGPRPSHPVEMKRFWTRRRFAGAAVAGLCVASGGAWWRWDDLEYLFEPLPSRRSVALMAWPNGQLSAVVSTVLDSIGQRLARAEAYVKDLLIITFRDLPGGGATPSAPAESVSALGANLVLAASLESNSSKHTLTLQVLDAASQRVLRKARVSLPFAELSDMSEKASSIAARLLGLPTKDIVMKDTDELRKVSPEVFQLFSEAEELASQPNGTGLEAALLKYQAALDKDPHSHFALCYARLAMAYVRQYQDGDPAKLRLAQDNATLATDSNPGSAKGWLSRAIVSMYSGKTEEAMGYFARSLKADPGNPETLVYKAEALRETRHWPEAEQVYRDISRQRPNYWLAHNELGWILFQQAQYQKAAEEFDAAAAAAPKVAMPLANLGLMYLALGKHDEAITASESSLKRSPNRDAYLTLGDIAFTDGNYRSALDDYQNAAALRPDSHLIWRNIGDCYAVLGNPALVKKNYAKATQLLAANLAANPRDASNWAILAFYHAKIGDAASAQTDLRNAEAKGATDVESQFMISQALALLGKKEEALKLLLACMDKGLSPVEAGLALDLKEIEKDPRYLSRVSRLRAPKLST
jgi:serine/threonine protein kinase/Tfp pilus assembly protein PilF